MIVGEEDINRPGDSQCKETNEQPGAMRLVMTVEGGEDGQTLFIEGCASMCPIIGMHIGSV